ncbi:MAG: signal peptidase I [Firmicutes bacterium]|nr:signal peptidase I [Bacillota bacterium]
MKLKNVKNSVLLISFVLYIVIYKLFIVTNYLKYIEFISASALILFTAVAIAFYGYRKDKFTPLTKQVTIITIMQITLFFALSYGIGLIVGFLKNSYSLTFYSIMNNVFAPIFIIISTEVLRYVFINGNKKNIKIIIFFTILLIIFETVLNVKSINLNDLGETFKILTATILPIIMKNSILSYLTYNVGYKPALIYRLVMDLYIFVMPLLPNLGEYIESMIGICLPFLIYLFASRTIDESYNGVEYQFEKSVFQITDIPIITFIVALVCLISGYFKIYAIGIATESMTPKINKGDAVIINKISSEKELKEGLVIVYTNNGKSIVHRLVGADKVDGKTYYRTKGDANPTVDNIDLEYKDIKGIVLFKIPYIAYPSIYFSEKVKLGA